jgi:hypothetical protein
MAALELVKAILEFMVQEGKAKWIELDRKKGTGVCIMLWRSIEEWGSLIYQWVKTFVLGQPYNYLTFV